MKKLNDKNCKVRIGKMGFLSHFNIFYFISLIFFHLFHKKVVTLCALYLIMSNTGSAPNLETPSLSTIS